MANKSYVIEFTWDKDTAVAKLKPFVSMLTSAYDLKMTENSPTSYSFTRAGVRAEVNIEDQKMLADIDLNMILEPIVRPKLEAMIERKIRPMIDKMQA